MNIYNTVNHRALVRVALIVTALFLTACSPGEPDAPAPQAPATDTADTHVIGKHLHEALDQAQQVEQVIQDGVDQREQAMKAQGL